MTTFLDIFCKKMGYILFQYLVTLYAAKNLKNQLCVISKHKNVSVKGL